ncbi:NAD(P)-dependent oxidoreductase [Escherichia coli]
MGRCRHVTLVEGPFDESLLDTCWLAIAATDDDALNQRVGEAAEARRIFCNVVDAPKAASFLCRRLLTAHRSWSRSPLAAPLRFWRACCAKTESLLPLHLGQGGEICRAIARASETTVRHDGERRRFWEKLFVNDRLAQSLANDDQKAITETTEQLINEPLDHRGEVVLVGAGPAMPGC